MENNTRLDFHRISTLLFIICSAFTVFVVPIKLGSPYIDELGLFVPTLIDIFFSTWPTLAVCTLGLLLFLIISFHALLRSSVHFRITKITLMLILFIGACAFSISTSVNPHASKVNFFLLCGSVTGYLAAKYLIEMKNKDLLLPIIVAIVSAAIFVSVNGIYQYYYGLDEMREMINIDRIRESAMLYKYDNPQNYALYQRIVSNRIFSTFVYPNSLAGYLCMLLPFILQMAYHYRKSFLRIYAWICIVSSVVLFLWFYIQSLFFFIPIAIGCIVLFPLAIVAALILTASKGGIIACILTLIVYFILFCKDKFSMRKRTVAIILLSLLALFVLIERTLLPSKMKSLTARIDYWKSSVEMIKDKPLFGYGLGTFGIVYPKYRITNAEETQFAHNTYLQIWVETGLVGFISYTAIWLLAIGAFIKKTFKNGLSFPQTAAGLAILAFAMHNIVDFDFSIPALSFMAFYFVGLSDTYNTDKTFNLSLHKNKLIILLVCALFTIITHKFITGYLDAQAYYDAARCVYKETRDANNALLLLDKALKKNNDNAKIHFLAATIFLNENDIETAIEFFRKAVERDWHRASYHYQLGLAYLKSSKNDARDKAIIEFSKAIEYNPQKQEYKKIYHELTSMR